MSAFEPILVSVEEACKMIGCGRTMFYELMAQGKVRAVKQGRRTVVFVSSLRAYAETLPTADLV